MHRILRKIFQSGNTRGQFFFAGFGFLLGIFMLCLALQMYLSIQDFLQSRNKFSEYLMISKKIKLSNTMMLSRADFKPRELENIQKQDFCEIAAPLTANSFEVQAFARGQVPLRTDLFFEAIDDQMLDIRPADWRWSPEDDFLPIIISQDMINLYNFGYALGKGLPQVSPSMTRLLKIKVVISGPKGRRVFDSRIVGLTERIPSVLVPKTFMDWANQNIGNQENKNPSRILMKVNNPADPKLAAYLERKNYQINQDRLNSSRAGALIQTAFSIIGLLGFLFMALSLVIFSSNFRVILAEAKQEIQLLLQLGYSTSVLLRFLFSYFGIFLILILGISYGLIYYSWSYIQDWALDNGLEIVSNLYPVVGISALAFTLLVFVINFLFVLRLIKSYL